MSTPRQPAFRTFGMPRQALMPIVCMLLMLMAACTSWQVPPEFDVGALRARAESETLRNVTLSAAVLSAGDSKKMFGVDVNSEGIQPVWVEVVNNTDQVLWLLRSGTDPDLFSPHEVAWSFRKAFAGERNDSLEQHFNSLSFQNPVEPGATAAGILYTNPHRKTRLLSIDLLGQAQLFPFTLFLQVPDDVSDEAAALARTLQLVAAATVDFTDTDAFRTALADLPCCASNAKGSANGDPLNLILVGDIDHIATAFVRRGFRMEVLDYDNAQHVYGRPPDIVARKTGHRGVPANWVRLWVAPFRHHGRTVILAQTGRPTGWRSAVRENGELQLNPDVDEARNLLIQDLAYSNGLEKLGFVTGTGATAPSETRYSLGGESYHTDGLRAVLFLTTRPLSLHDLEFLDWYPYLQQYERDTTRALEQQNR